MDASEPQPREQAPYRPWPTTWEDAAVLDLVIAGARVVDGDGGPAFFGWVGVDGERIAEVGRGVAPPAGRTIEVAGKVLAPGFVDVHTHSDLGPLVDPRMPSALRQGVTTQIVGNCGASPWPRAGYRECALIVGADPERAGPATFAGYLGALESARPATNVAALVGHGAIRDEVMPERRRPPDADELRSMAAAVVEAMEAGALGLSTGLIYVPGMFAGTDEVVVLAAEAGRRGGIYASHIRGEGEHLFPAIEEALAVGRRAELPAHVSHLKCETSLAWGRAEDLLGRLHRGEDVSADQYPYTSWASTLWSLLPPWAPVRKLPVLLEDGAVRARLAAAIEGGEGATFQSSVKGVGWDRLVVESTADIRWNGRSIAQIAEEIERPCVDACLELLIEDPDTAVIGHAMREDDVRTILADPDIMVASDGASMSPDGPLGAVPVHPRNYGTFPRVLGPYVRDRVLGLEVAVRKMTSLPCDRFGLRRRGRIRRGHQADLVVFDPSTVTDLANADHPHAYPHGIELVVVNGAVAWDGMLGERRGRVLRRGDT
jgi:N-acyl-D-aspartate/D-glutamate deacylase